MQKIGQILNAILEKKPRTLKIGHLIPFNPGLTFFNKRNLVKTMHAIVIYNDAKNWEVPVQLFWRKGLIKSQKKNT